MSWKGFTKAISRLPHMVMQKAGAVAETKDENFDRIRADFLETKDTLVKVNDGLVAWRDDHFAFLDAVCGCVEGFLAMFLVSGECTDIINISTSIKTKLPQMSRKIREILEADFREECLDVLEKVLEMANTLEKKAEKRRHKKIDFDRTLHTLNKMDTKSLNSPRSVSEERKYQKLQEEHKIACTLYEKFNETLKEDLPIASDCINNIVEQMVYIHARIEREIDALIVEAFDEFGDRSMDLEKLREWFVREYSKLEDRSSGEDDAILKSSSKTLSQNSDSSVNSNSGHQDNYLEQQDREELDIPMTKFTEIHSPKTPFVKNSNHAHYSKNRNTHDDGDRDNKAKQSTSPPPSTPNHSLNRNNGSQSQSFSASASIHEKDKNTSSFYARQSSSSISNSNSGNSNAKGSVCVNELAAKFAALKAKAEAKGTIPTTATPKSAPPQQLEKDGKGPIKQMATALYDFNSDVAGDLTFRMGERVQILEKSEIADDWWTGRIDRREGIFPGTYVKLD